MGSLYYGSDTEPIEMPDSLLAHVKVVVATKLRRGESFTMTWQHPVGQPAGRSTIWLQPAIPLRFVFDEAESEALDSAFLKQLAVSANSSAGLSIELIDPPQATDAATVPARPVLRAA